MALPNGNVFNGLAIPNDATLTPSDGIAPGSSAIVAGLGEDTDVVVTLINPSNAPVQMYWSENDGTALVWSLLGQLVSDSQQTPMRLRSGKAYRFESSGTDARCYMENGPVSLEYDELTDQGLVA